MAGALKVVEFYSGIGGMHLAIDATGLPYKIVAALELNDIANRVYRFNFPDVNLLQKNIEGLTVKEMEQFNADCILMSPPCQPFTRLGKQKASDDPRTTSFLKIIDILKSMNSPPKYILMENVKGFEVSGTRNHFVATLDEAGYNIQEFLISPKQFGIPNSRLRYYLLAKLKPLRFCFEPKSELLTAMPSSQCRQFQVGNHAATNEMPTKDVDAGTANKDPNGEISRLSLEDSGIDGNDQANTRLPSPLSEFLENSTDVPEDLFLTADVLGKLGSVLDIVTPSSTNSCCFTKGYGSYVKGTGSVLSCKTTEEIEDAFSKIDSTKMDNASAGSHLLSLGLRYFSSREIANLMCFPKSFGFPADVTSKQQNKLLGNSVNVLVVSQLLKRCLITERS